jgi:hypothetical protein
MGEPFARSYLLARGECCAGLSERGNGLQQLDAPRGFPFVSSLPRLPLMIPDEILDYFGWVFCQGGFLNLQMTFEQFLMIVAAVSPTALCPEYDESGPVRSSD